MSIYHSPQSIRFMVWWHTNFFQNNFFNNQFWSFQAQFRTYLPCTSQWGKFSSSRLCIFDFRNEIYTKFQSRKHVLFHILAIFIFPPFWQSNTTRISILVIQRHTLVLMGQIQAKCSSQACVGDLSLIFISNDTIVTFFPVSKSYYLWNV